MGIVQGRALFGENLEDLMSTKPSCWVEGRQYITHLLRLQKVGWGGRGGYAGPCTGVVQTANHCLGRFLSFMKQADCLQISWDWKKLIFILVDVSSILFNSMAEKQFWGEECWTFLRKKKSWNNFNLKGDFLGNFGAEENLKHFWWPEDLK